MERKTMQTKANTGYEGGYCANVKAVLNRHSRHVIASETKQSGNVLECALLSRAGRIALFLLMVMVVALWVTDFCFAQLANSPWPMRGHDARHTGQSPYKGPEFANLKWKFETGDDVYSSPAIGSDGTVYVGSWDNNLYALNPDGNLKWKFETGQPITSSLAIGSDGTVFVESDNLYAINPDGSIKWRSKISKNAMSNRMPVCLLDKNVARKTIAGMINKFLSS